MTTHVLTGRRLRATLPPGAHPALALALALLVLPLAAPAARAQRPDSSQRADSGRTDRARRLEGVTVTAVRARGDAPISQRTVEREEIERRYAGQDVPLVLQGAAPSVWAYSETGTYWGYSYLRLRGIDQSRINLTLDGIPLNDPEDQVLYFADFPDLANSVQSVQVQRGVGTSSTGTAAYAGSINFETVPLAATRSAAELQLGAGSWSTRRVSAEYHSGLLPSRFAVYARLSALSTAGYRYNSGARGRSAFLSAGWFGDRDILKLTATAGLFSDTMAYYAVAESDLQRDRRLNPLDNRHRDQFGEQLVSLAWTRLLGERSSVSTTLYRISAGGDYDVAWDADLYNYALDFAWYGLTSTWSWTRGNARVASGVNANTYARDHHAYLRPDLATPLYLNTGHKRDASGFVKLAYDVGRATLFADAQGRWAEFRYTPDRAAGVGELATDWRFLNPKLGASVRLAPALSAYASYGVNGREPTRSDMFAGLDNLDSASAAFVGDLRRVQPERVHDTEVGVSYETPALLLQGNVFDMRFRNEIAPIGAINELGTPLRKNVPRSTRRGVELEARWRPVARLELGGHATVMRGRIARYTDDASGATFEDVEPLLTPRLLAAHRASLGLTRTLTVGLDGRYTGRAYLSNTGDRRFMLPASYVGDASLRWMRGRTGVSLLVNNVNGSRGYASGYTDGSTSYFYVLPPRNVLLTAQLGW